MREQFEKLREITVLLSFRTAIHWNEKRGKYESHDNTDVYNCIYLNGAWYAFQKQQTIINDLKAQLECCRKENAVLLGKVGDGEKVASLVESLVSKSEQFGFESEQAEAVLMDLWKALRGAS